MEIDTLVEELTALGMTRDDAVSFLQRAQRLNSDDLSKWRRSQRNLRYYIKNKNKLREESPPLLVLDDEAPPKQKRAMRMTAAWQPTEREIQFAVAKAGWPSQKIAEEIDKFKDYWIAHPNQKGKAASPDWPARWRTWVRNALDYAERDKTKRNGHGNGSFIAEAMNMIGEDHEHEPDQASFTLDSSEYHSRH
jgi:hypothetical protein